MVGIVVVTRAALLIARRASTWTIDEHFGGRSPECVAVDSRDPTRLYCGTAGAGLFRGGDSWVDLAGLRALPSADTWSFPPRPHTHHVRWIEADVSAANRVFVAIEAGALVRSFDGGRTWRDRVRGGP